MKNEIFRRMLNIMKKIYDNRKVVLLTKHEKEKAIRLTLENETGCELIVESRFDTDTLGTFSREIKRSQSQFDTARTKIREGMKLANTDIGIASEGSFGSHAYAPIPWHVEIVLLVDQKENMEIYGVYEGSDTNFDHLKTNAYEGALKFAEKVGFPEHFLILRPDDEFSENMFKGIDSFDQLKEIFDTCLAESKSGNVFIETDMRAHANPTRMNNIEKATHNLISRLMNFCPTCDTPGFIISQVIKGLPCELCGLPSEMTLKFVYSCYKCKHEQEELFPRGHYAPARYCHYCNP